MILVYLVVFPRNLQKEKKMSVGSVVNQATNATAQHPGVNPGQRPEIQVNPMSPEELLRLSNTPDDVLELAAKYDAYQKYNDDPTRTVTSIVGNTVPFADSFMTGALTKGPASHKVAATANKGTDWAIFVGAVWLYNKALSKVYDNFPGLKQVKEDHPGVALVGEIGSAVLVGEAAIWGANKAFAGLVGKSKEQTFTEFFTKKAKTSEFLAKPLMEVSKFAEKHPNIVKYSGLGVTVLLVGLIAKNIFDAHRTKVNTDKKLAELKDQRYDTTKALLDQQVQAGQV